MSIDLGGSLSSVILCTRNAETAYVGELKGGPNTSLEGPRSAAGTTIWNIGGLNTSTVFYGIIENADPSETTTGLIAGVTKSGTGTWMLAGQNTYTGPTTVSNGTLGLTNAGAVTSFQDASIALSTNIFINTGAVLDLSGLSASPPTLTIPMGGTLAGAGTVKGAVNTSLNAATLSLGIGASGSLGVTNSVTVGGPVLVSLDHPADTGAANGSLTARSLTVNFGATLIVTQGTNDLVSGDTFKIFNIATGNPIYTAANLVITLPTNAPVSGITYVWNTNQLAVNGTLVLTTGGPPPVNLQPANMVFGVSSGQLNLAWPANQTGWTLQTNSVNVGSNQLWFAYPGSSSVNSVSIPVTTNKTVFFRLYHP
jgi:autotransporter-associated beta strand protein